MPLFGVVLVAAFAVWIQHAPDVGSTGDFFQDTTFTSSLAFLFSFTCAVSFSALALSFASTVAFWASGVAD